MPVAPSKIELHWKALRYYPDTKDGLRSKGYRFLEIDPVRGTEWLAGPWCWWAVYKVMLWPGYVRQWLWRYWFIHSKGHPSVITRWRNIRPGPGKRVIR